MPARTTRRQARQRIIDAFMASLDKVIPPEESVPLRGRTFLDWEKQAEQLKRAVIPTLLEERSALEENASVERGGNCPYCGSERVYLQRQTSKVEAHSPDGPLVIEKQHCRCRCCDGSFSPSES
jgi:DNA-directed RNA polymerase subunit RPC12/RpoP